MTLVPWEKGRPLVLDARALIPLSSHISGTTVRDCAAANLAEDPKKSKYLSLLARDTRARTSSA